MYGENKCLGGFNSVPDCVLKRFLYTACSEMMRKTHKRQDYAVSSSQTIAIINKLNTARASTATPRMDGNPREEEALPRT